MLDRKILNILSGDKDFTNKTILNTNTLGFELADVCISPLFTSKIGIFVPEVPERQKKGQKNTSLECLGHKRGTKLILIIEKKRVINHHEMQISLW